jgi:5-methylcytosine-specific restriction endonuclease McrA
MAIKKSITNGSRTITNGSRTIPKALREQVWIKQFGRTFETKCPISWCNNIITVFDFESGHNIPFSSKKGKTTLENLIPICSRCNKSMSNNYTIDQWNNIENIVNNKIKIEGKNEGKNKRKRRWYCCFVW